MKKIGIGIIGLGNIGSRLYKEIISKKKDIGLKTNTNINQNPQTTLIYSKHRAYLSLKDILCL